MFMVKFVLKFRHSTKRKRTDIDIENLYRNITHNMLIFIKCEYSYIKYECEFRMPPKGEEP